MLRPRQIYFLEKLIDKTKDSIFIVEGKRDKKVLSELGIKHIFSISGKSLENVAERMETEIEKRKKRKNIVILTDFDRDGKRKAEKLMRLFRSSHIPIERKARNFFKKSLKVTKIEELKKIARLLSSTEDYTKELNRRAFSKRRRKSKWKLR